MLLLSFDKMNSRQSDLSVGIFRVRWAIPFDCLIPRKSIGSFSQLFPMPSRLSFLLNGFESRWYFLIDLMDLSKVLLDLENTVYTSCQYHSDPNLLQLFLHPAKSPPLLTRVMTSSSCQVFALMCASFQKLYISYETHNAIVYPQM